MESSTHFLTIEKLSKDGTKYYRHEFYFLEESKRISQQVNVYERLTGAPIPEEFISPKSITISDFSVNVDRYMSHPGVVFSDDTFVENLMSDYIFSESYETCE